MKGVTVTRETPAANTCPHCGQVMAQPVFRVDLNSNIVFVGSRSAKLTPVEAEVFMAIFERHPHIVHRDRITTRVYGDWDPPVSKVLDVHVMRIRRKLAHVGIKIRNEHGRGYAVEYNPS